MMMTLDPTSQAWSLIKIDELDLIKIENFCQEALSRESEDKPQRRGTYL